MSIIPNLHDIEKRVLVKSVDNHAFFREFVDRFGNYRFNTEVRNWIFQILRESKDGSDLNKLVLRRKRRKGYKKLVRVYRTYKKGKVEDSTSSLLGEFDIVSRSNSNLIRLKSYVELIKKGEYEQADSLLGEGFSTTSEGMLDEIEVSENIEEELENIVDAESRDVVGKFGFRALDRSTGGIWVGDFILLFGRSAVGKSIFMLNIAHNVRSEGGKFCIINLEMSNTHVRRRYLSRVSRLDYKKKFKMGRLNDKQKKRIKTAMKSTGMLGGKLYIVSVKGQCTLGILKSIVRKYKVEKGVDVFGIDFIDCVHSGRRMFNEQHELGMVSETIKELAKEYETGIIGVTHQNFYSEDAEEEGVLVQRDVGYSQRKVQFCDIALGMIRSNRDREEGLMSFQAVKVRDTDSDLAFKLKPVLNRMRFEEIN